MNWNGTHRPKVGIHLSRPTSQTFQHIPDSSKTSYQTQDTPSRFNSNGNSRSSLPSPYLRPPSEKLAHPPSRTDLESVRSARNNAGIPDNHFTRAEEPDAFVRCRLTLVLVHLARQTSARPQPDSDLTTCTSTSPTRPKQSHHISPCRSGVQGKHSDERFVSALGINSPV